MGAVHEFRVRHNKFVDNLPSYIEGVVDDNKELLDLNREQLMSGRKSSGKYLPAYSNRSVEEFGKPTGPILLYDTGEFPESFTITAKGSAYDIQGDDLYDLAKTYGQDIYGIAKWNQPNAKQITSKSIAEQYKEIVYTK